MTSIAAWASVDPHGVSALYIASDSRISWGDSYRWDFGRKTFAARMTPHIFGYWGQVLFPALAIPVVVEMLDRQLIDVSRNPTRSVTSAIRQLWRDYPNQERRDVGIVHGHRRGAGKGARFTLAVMTYSAEFDKWTGQTLPMPATSAILVVKGSGSAAVKASSELWQASPQGNTSRAAFGSFCEALNLGTDPQSGGGTQLVGLRRKSEPAQTYGTVIAGRRYFAGAPVTAVADTSEVQFFNELFERADPRTRKRLRGAQKHPPR